MESAKSKFRSKHATLILKCYPRYTKSATTVQPNSSELNYLLYYASTRRSKLQKVGLFLQKKTAHDVHKNKLANVQVTLQITNALIQKLPRDLPLYATYILDILVNVLQSQDLSMVEESIPTFEGFCRHQDVTTIAASQSLIDQFEEVIRIYASYAALKTPVVMKGGLNTPIAIRWRTAGLKALKSVSALESIGAEGGRQMSNIMPVILQNLHSGDPDHLLRLQHQARSEEGTDRPARENARRRRMSVATSKTSEKSRPNSSAVDGAIDEADLIAEEEVGLLALQCLKQIFTGNNRMQIRLATNAMLHFICNEAPSKRPATNRSGRTGLDATWSTTLIESVAQWTPVQDRFAILTTTMEAVLNLPVTEDKLAKHLQLCSLIDWLLRSDINMIGLSVMDILIGLLQHMTTLLQHRPQTSELPQHEETGSIDIFKDAQATLNDPGSPAITETSFVEENTQSVQEKLLAKLRRCIAGLAMHVYYSDQVLDLVNAVLGRFRAPGNISPRSKKEQDEEENFNSGTARMTGLNILRDILLVANTKSSVASGVAFGRSRVGIEAWSNTKWLVKDPDPRVRRAYVDTLLTWCRLERSPEDAATLESQHPEKSSLSQLPHPRQTGFLPEQHPEIYHVALEFRQSDNEMSLFEALIYELDSKKPEDSRAPKNKLFENGLKPPVGLNKPRLYLNVDGSPEVSPLRRLSIQTSNSNPSTGTPRQPVRFERLRQIMYEEQGQAPSFTGSHTRSLDFSFPSSRPSSMVSKSVASEALSNNNNEQGNHVHAGNHIQSAGKNGSVNGDANSKTEKASIEDRTIVARPSTSSSREDPEVNAAALRGQRLSVEAESPIPPVPPLPKGLGKNVREEDDERVDVADLLRRIPVNGDVNGRGGKKRERVLPPY